MKFGCIGCGKMGYSVIKGILNANICGNSDIFTYEINTALTQKLLSEGINIATSYNNLFESCDVILLAIKPQEARQVLENITDTGNCRLVISIMAGISISDISSINPEISIARVMPNTCAVIGESASCISYSDNISSELKQLTKNIFDSIGSTVEIDESLMDDIIPISGSFTAFAYYFMQAFIASSIKRGIDEDIAKKLVIQSMIGSAKMVSQFSDIEQLINDVCSKGGTTLAGLDQLKANNFIQTIDKCAKACTNRSKELSKQTD